MFNFMFQFNPSIIYNRLFVNILFTNESLDIHTTRAGDLFAKRKAFSIVTTTVSNIFQEISCG